MSRKNMRRKMDSVISVDSRGGNLSISINPLLKRVPIFLSEDIYGKLKWYYSIRPLIIEKDGYTIRFWIKEGTRQVSRFSVTISTFCTETVICATKKKGVVKRVTLEK